MSSPGRMVNTYSGESAMPTISQVAAAAVDDGADAVAGVDAARQGEPFADEHLVRRGRPTGSRPRRRKRSFSVGACGTGIADEAPGRRLAHAGDVERHVDDDARVDARHARDLGDALRAG